MRFLQVKILLYLWLPLFLNASELSHFNTQTWTMQGRIKAFTAADFNGDRKQDLLLSVTVNDQPHLRIFLQKSGQFATTSIPCHPPSDAIAYDAADLNADGQDEILILTAEGFSIAALNQDQIVWQHHLFRKITPLFTIPVSHALPEWSLIFQAEPLSWPQLLIPTRTGYMQYVWQGNEYRPVQQLYLPPKGEADNRGMTVKPARLELHDFNGDGFRDFLGLNSRLNVFFHREYTDMFANTLPLFRYTIGQEYLLLTDIETLRTPTQTHHLTDLNRDGCVDLITSHGTQGAFTHGISHLQIFLNKNGRLPELPDQVITASNFSGEFYVQDFNRDGRLDVAVAYQSIGIMEGMRLLFTRKTRMGFDIYLMNPDGRYPDAPSSSIRFSRQPHIADLLDYKMGASFKGDFNGDTIPDGLVFTETEQLTLFFGDQNGNFSNDQKENLKFLRADRFHIDDMNRDGISDFLGIYPAPPDSTQLTVLLSR